MPITILSPYSGRPVKVRDQDLERAIRDEEGRIFYVVEGTDGKGYYASMTRKGSDKDQERYRKLDEKGAVVDQRAKQNVQQLHDATGTKRRNPVGIFILLLIILAVIAGGYVYLQHPEWLGLGDDTTEQPLPDAPGTPGMPDPDAPQSNIGDDQALASAAPVRVISVASYAQASPAITDDLVRDVSAALTLDPVPEAEAEAEAEAESAVALNHDPSEAASDDHTVQVESEAEAEAEPSTPADTEASNQPQPAPTPAPRTWRPETAAASGAPRAGADNIDWDQQNPFADFRVTASGLRYKTTHLTDGDPALIGCFLHIRFAAYTLDHRTLVDDAQQQFVIMTGRAIRALDEGLAGMRAGEQRVIFVPKGHSTAGQLPGLDRLPNEPFVLDVQLLAVRPGVTHIVEHPGEGEPARPGDTLTLQYEAWVEGRTESFDSSALRNQPMRITLGQDAVIPGLELGVTGMQPGETRLLTIPPYLAYGDREIADGLIPANAVLTFRVTALDVQPPREDDTE